MHRKILLAVCSVALLASLGFYWKQRQGSPAAKRAVPYIRNVAAGATISGAETLEVVLSEDDFKTNTIPRLSLQIDGGEFRMNAPERYSDEETREKFVRSFFSTDDYANGPHTLRVVDSKGRADVRKVIFRNTVYRAGTDGNGSLSATLSAKQPWTVIVEGSDYKPIRTYHGNSSKIRVTWDGKDNVGKIRVDWPHRWERLPDDRYEFRLRIAGEQDRIYMANSLTASK